MDDPRTETEIIAALRRHLDNLNGFANGIAANRPRQYLITTVDNMRRLLKELEGSILNLDGGLK